MAVTTTAANGLFLSVAGGTVTGALTVTGSIVSPSVSQSGTTSRLTLCGGNNAESSGTLYVYGNGHATQAGDLEYYAGTVRQLFFDLSADTWNINGSTSVQNLGIYSGVGSSSTPFSMRRDQASITRAILSNNSSTSASAYAQASLVSDAGDFNIGAYSVAGGASVELNSQAGFTAGITIKASAGQVILNSNGGSTIRATSGGVGILSIGGFGNNASASGPVGTVVGKIRVTDGSANWIGYLPVYDAIT